MWVLPPLGWWSHKEAGRVKTWKQVSKQDPSMPSVSVRAGYLLLLAPVLTSFRDTQCYGSVRQANSFLPKSF